MAPQSSLSTSPVFPKLLPTCFKLNLNNRPYTLTPVSSGLREAVPASRPVPISHAHSPFPITALQGPSRPEPLTPAPTPGPSSQAALPAVAQRPSLRLQNIGLQATGSAPARGGAQGSRPRGGRARARRPGPDCKPRRHTEQGLSPPEKWRAQSVPPRHSIAKTGIRTPQLETWRCVR